MCVQCIAQPGTDQAAEFHKETSDAYAAVAVMLKARRESAPTPTCVVCDAEMSVESRRELCDDCRDEAWRDDRADEEREGRRY